jgi:hypothetical protein
MPASSPPAAGRAGATGANGYADADVPRACRNRRANSSTRASISSRTERYTAKLNPYGSAMSQSSIGGTKPSKSSAPARPVIFTMRSAAAIASDRSGFENCPSAEIPCSPRAASVCAVTSPYGTSPALEASITSEALCLATASAIWLLQAFPMHKNKTFVRRGTHFPFSDGLPTRVYGQGNPYTFRGWAFSNRG